VQASNAGVVPIIEALPGSVVAAQVKKYAALEAQLRGLAAEVAGSGDDANSVRDLDEEEEGDEGDEEGADDTFGVDNVHNVDEDGDDGDDGDDESGGGASGRRSGAASASASAAPLSPAWAAARGHPGLPPPSSASTSLEDKEAAASAAAMAAPMSPGVGGGHGDPGGLSLETPQKRADPTGVADPPLPGAVVAAEADGPPAADVRAMPHARAGSMAAAGAAAASLAPPVLSAPTSSASSASSALRGRRTSAPRSRGSAAAAVAERSSLSPGAASTGSRSSLATAAARKRKAEAAKGAAERGVAVSSGADSTTAPGAEQPPKDGASSPPTPLEKPPSLLLRLRGALGLGAGGGGDPHASGARASVGGYHSLSPLLRTLSRRMATALAVLLGLQALSTAINTVAVIDASYTASSIDIAGFRRELAVTATFQARELLIGADVHGDWIYAADVMRKYCDQLRSYHTALLYGNERLRVSDTLGLDPEQDALLFAPAAGAFSVRPGANLSAAMGQQNPLAMQGLHMLLMAFLAEADTFLTRFEPFVGSAERIEWYRTEVYGGTTPPFDPVAAGMCGVNLTCVIEDSSWQRLNVMSFELLDALLGRSIDLYRRYADAKADRALSVQVAVFAANVFVLAMLHFFGFRMQFGLLEEEATRTLEFVQLIPAGEVEKEGRLREAVRG
jgi:hypothetical protein